MTMLRIGTRGSELALWQARSVAGILKATGVQSELVIIKTTGDRIQDKPLTESGGKRLFVKEIEDALLAGEVDLAVHSAKDMPALLAQGLAVAATLGRDDPRDAFVGPRSLGVYGHPNVHGSAVPDLCAIREAFNAGQQIGTSSVRRMAQLRSVFPKAAFTPVRGNVDTRLRKLDEGGYDALVLAAAGLRRLGFGARITTVLPVEHCVPAPGQGIIAIETRADDRNTMRVLERLNDARAWSSLRAERALVAALGGGCQLPLGGLALHEGGALEMHAVVATPDGRRTLKRRGRAPVADAESLGARTAEELLKDGAGEILDAVRKESE
jgi:hydroxymethylbilane synthase